MKAKDIREMLDGRPLSYSSLKEFAKSPLHYVHYLTAPRKDTDAFILGDVVDVLLLTPDEYEKRFFVTPKLDMRKAKNKKIMKELVIKNEGKRWITEDVKLQADRMVASARNNSVVQKILPHLTAFQITLRWKHKQTKLPCIGKVDAEGEILFAELKTAISAQPDDYSRSAFNFDYPLQLGMYATGYKFSKFKFPDPYYIVIEKTEPYAVCVFRPTEDYIKYGINLYNKLMMKFNYCLEKDLFHEGYEFNGIVGSGYHHLDLPGYAKYKLNQEEGE